MGGIRLREVTKEFDGGVIAVDDVTLDIADGEFMVLVGPSGCGKSTLLRMIAGLEDVTYGTIEIGDRDVTELEPRHRDVAMVFQNYALYPHFDVRANIGFGLRLRKAPKDQIAERVGDAAQTLGLQEYLDRKPAQLSGGQRQRVAMGRAMVRSPEAYLMDEPLSNLDAKLRVAMRAELARLHGHLGVTTVYVTHDQVEAMTLGMRVAVLRDGVLQQCDTPEQLYRRPKNAFVAAFIGSPAMNLVEAGVRDGAVELGGQTIPLVDEAAGALAEHRTVVAGIRPTDFVLAGPEVDPALPRLTVVPDVIEHLGSEIVVVFPVDATGIDVDDRGALTLGGDAQLMASEQTHLTASLEEGAPVEIGQPVELAVRHARMHFFDRETGVRLERSSSARAPARES